MSKVKTIFVCSNCGNDSPKWLGRCPACNEWNTFYEEKISNNTSKSEKRESKNLEPIILNSLEGKDTIRTTTGIEEFDRVLGGGLVKGSLLLLGGEPGIRKINFNFANL